MKIISDIYTVLLTTLRPPSKIRPLVGFNDTIPQKAAGIRTLPARSVPNPKIDPPYPRMAPSPLDDPPGPRFLSCGFAVAPYIGFELPKLNIVCGTFVKQKGLAPRSFNL